MKTKLLPIMVVGILVLSRLGVAAIIDDTTYYVRNTEELIAISEPIIDETNQYVTVNLRKATSSLSKAGEPVLPVVTKEFILPFGSKIRHVDVSFSEANKIVLSKQVQPGPEPIPKTGLRMLGKPVKNQEIYEGVELYPSDSFKYNLGAGIKGDRRVIFLKIHCYPVRYSPGLNVLYYSDNIDIKVVYREPVVPLSFPDQYDMVIIAPGMFSEELQPLIDHKNSRGVQTVLKTTEDIYSEYAGRDAPEKIK